MVTSDALVETWLVRAPTQHNLSAMRYIVQNTCIRTYTCKVMDTTTYKHQLSVPLVCIHQLLKYSWSSLSNCPFLSALKLLAE